VREPFSGKGDDHVLDAGQPPLALGGDFRLEAGIPVPGNRDFFGPVSVSTVFTRWPLRGFPLLYLQSLTKYTGQIHLGLTKPGFSRSPAARSSTSTSGRGVTWRADGADASNSPVRQARIHLSIVPHDTLTARRTGPDARGMPARGPAGRAAE